MTFKFSIVGKPTDDIPLELVSFAFSIQKMKIVSLASKVLFLYLRLCSSIGAQVPLTVNVSPSVPLHLDFRGNVSAECLAEVEMLQDAFSRQSSVLGPLNCEPL